MRSPVRSYRHIGPMRISPCEFVPKREHFYPYTGRSHLLHGRQATWSANEHVEIWVLYGRINNWTKTFFRFCFFFFFFSRHRYTRRFVERDRRAHHLVTIDRQCNAHCGIRQRSRAYLQRYRTRHTRVAFREKCLFLISCIDRISYTSFEEYELCTRDTYYVPEIEDTVCFVTLVGLPAQCAGPQ